MEAGRVLSFGRLQHGTAPEAEVRPANERLIEAVAGLREDLAGISQAIRGLSTDRCELITPEAVAERLGIKKATLTRRMKSGVLPKGVVWFETPLGCYFNWPKLVALLQESDSGALAGEDDGDITPWRKSA